MKQVLLLLLLPSFCRAQFNTPSIVGFSTVSATPASCGCTIYDANTCAFVTASGITDSTEISAICTLVKQLKDSSLWDKFYAIYPFVGGASASCKYNLKDPRDLDAAYRLTFSGGWTFSGTGALPNGTTGYANTHLNPSVSMTSRNTHIASYLRTNSDGAFWDIGAFNGGSIMELLTRNGNIMDSRLYYRNSGVYSVPNTDSRGLWLSTCTGVSSTDMGVYRNGLLFSAANITPIQGALINLDLYISALNYAGTPGYFSNREQAIASIGKGLTSVEAATMNHIFNAFTTTLGR